MRAYKVFRVLMVVCVLLVLSASCLYYFDKIETKFFAVASGALAVLATVFASLMARPSEPEDLAAVADKLLMTYDEDTLSKLRMAKAEESRLRTFIDFKSNEIFNLKLRTYLTEELEKKYKGSEIERLIEEIQEVETELRRLNVEFDETKLPERFKEFISHLERRRAVDLMLEMVDALPFFPLKKLAKYI
jgi:DNA repair ATPase RecN